MKPGDMGRNGRKLTDAEQEQVIRDMWTERAKSDPPPPPGSASLLELHWRHTHWEMRRSGLMSEIEAVSRQLEDAREAESMVSGAIKPGAIAKLIAKIQNLESEAFLARAEALKLETELKRRVLGATPAGKSGLSTSADKLPSPEDGYVLERWPNGVDRSVTEYMEGKMLSRVEYSESGDPTLEYENYAPKAEYEQKVRHTELKKSIEQLLRFVPEVNVEVSPLEAGQSAADLRVSVAVPRTYIDAVHRVRQESIGQETTSPSAEERIDLLKQVQDQIENLVAPLIPSQPGEDRYRKVAVEFFDRVESLDRAFVPVITATVKDTVQADAGVPKLRSSWNRYNQRNAAYGFSVEQLQERLNERVKPSPGLDVDGDYGPMTESAVRRFQRASGLPESGFADAATRDALGLTDQASPRELPTRARVVEFTPTQGASDVDPDLQQITIRFDRPMAPRMLLKGMGGTTPLFVKRQGETWTDPTTCVLAVKLKPATFYSVEINPNGSPNIYSAEGVPAANDVLWFATAGAKETTKLRLERPRAVELSPAMGEEGVNPNLEMLIVNFNTMMQKGASLVPTEGGFPDMERARWFNNQMSCVVPVKLKPGVEYAISLNGPRDKNFKSISGVPLEPVVWRFKTVGAAELADAPELKAITPDSAEAIGELQEKLQALAMDRESERLLQEIRVEVEKAEELAEKAEKIAKQALPAWMAAGPPTLNEWGLAKLQGFDFDGRRISTPEGPVAVAIEELVGQLQSGLDLSKKRVKEKTSELIRQLVLNSVEEEIASLQRLGLLIKDELKALQKRLKSADARMNAARNEARYPTKIKKWHETENKRRNNTPDRTATKQSSPGVGATRLIVGVQTDQAGYPKQNKRYGHSVEELQRRLNEVVTPSPDLAIDGDYGPLTESAVRQFQAANGLPATGFAGEATREALGLAPNAEGGGEKADDGPAARSEKWPRVVAEHNTRLRTASEKVESVVVQDLLDSAVLLIDRAELTLVSAEACLYNAVAVWRDQPDLPMAFQELNGGNLQSAVNTLIGFRGVDLHLNRVDFLQESAMACLVEWMQRIDTKKQTVQHTIEFSENVEALAKPYRDRLDDIRRRAKEIKEQLPTKEQRDELERIIEQSQERIAAEAAAEQQADEVD